MAKFSELNPWCTKIVTGPFGGGVWRTIRGFLALMESNLKFMVVADGDEIKLWNEEWTDHIFPMESFPDLFFNL